MIIKSFEINKINLDLNNLFLLYGKNNGFKNELKLFSNNNPDKIYDIALNSNYQKGIISKNTSGVATNYNISADVEINLSLNGKIINLIFNENMNIKNNSNSFEQNNYEKNIKRNFASSIREKLIIKLLELDDN